MYESMGMLGWRVCEHGHVSVRVECMYESMGMLGWRVCEHGHVRVRVECMRAWGC